MTTTVILTGASGYLGQAIVKQLIESKYNVVGTVRSAEKGDGIVKNAGKQFTYEIVEEIGAPHAFEQVLKKHPEATVFLHQASPVNFETTDPKKDLVDPAVNGVKNALSAIKQFGPQIKNVVLTSSVAAYVSGEQVNDPKVLINEKSWDPITPEEVVDASSGYYASKTFGEKAAWDFVKAEKPNFKFTSVSPVFITGPQAYESEVKDVLRTTGQYVKGILDTKPGDELSPFAAAFIDVRDVAKAHLAAFENPQAANQRLLLANANFDIPQIARVIEDLFPQFKGKISTGGPNAKENTFAQIDDSKSRKILGYEYHSLKESIKDAVGQILAAKK